MTTLRPPLLLLLALTAGAPAARAAQSYDSCTGFIDTVPAIIGTQGVWCLRKDLATPMSTGAAIWVDANNVTIDCNHFKLGGLAAGLATDTYGIGEIDRANTTVRQCNIRGFRNGVVLDGGVGHLVEDNRLEANTVVGIYADGDMTTVRRNLVLDTGGRPGHSEPAAIYAIDNVDILDNTVDGVAPDAADSNANGIVAINNAAGSISGNRIRGLTSVGAGFARSIRSTSPGRIQVRGNQLYGNGGAGDLGIICIDNLGTAADNVIAGFPTPISGCYASGNRINPN